mgnify:CR=1 FL=1|jgi:pteridine reductase
MNSQDEQLKNKVALITGGAIRIGASIARALHAEGMNLVIHYHSSAEDARALQVELHKVRPESVMLIGTDLRELAKLEKLVGQTTETFGRLDVLVNNASNFYPTPVGETSEAQWEDLVGVNLKAPYFLAQAAAGAMAETGGCIVNLVDIYAERPLKSHPVYNAAKAGLIALTRSLARDLAPEIRVNAVAPGAILWPDGDADQIAQQRLISRTPLKRIGEPEDIARTVLFLIRDAGFLTGQVVNVDGGRSIVP